jgi:hypothetical protein
MEPAKAPLRIVIPVKYVICTKRAAVTGGNKLSNGDVVLHYGKEEWFWTFYFEDRGGITFCLGDIAPPNWKPKARIILELEPDALPSQPPVE